MSNIGIYSGVFDPIHNGHVAFALAAIKQAKLDEVYFLIEAKPRRKIGVTHLAHRIAMVKLAIEDNRALKVLDLPDKQFSVGKTLPRLRQHFPQDKLFFLAGSDMLEHMHEWQLIDKMFKNLELIVGVRQQSLPAEVNALLKQLPTQPPAIIVNSPEPKLSSATIRQTLLNGKRPNGLKPKVLTYIKEQWLYASPSNSSSAS